MVRKANTKSGSKGKPGLSFASAAKSVSGSWKKARKVEDDGGGGIPEIDDGVYIVKWKGISSGVFPARKAKKVKGQMLAGTPPTPWTTLRFIVLRGPFKGTTFGLFLKFGKANQKFAATQLSRLLAEDQELPETVEAIPAFLAKLMKEFKDENLLLRVKVENDEYDGKKQLQVYVNEVLPAEDVEDDDEEEEDDADSDADDSDEEESEDDDSDDSDEESEDESDDDDDDSDSNEEEEESDDEEEEDDDSEEVEEVEEDEDSDDDDEEEEEVGYEEDDENAPEDVTGIKIGATASFVYRKKKLTGSVARLNKAKGLVGIQCNDQEKPHWMKPSEITVNKTKVAAKKAPVKSSRSAKPAKKAPAKTAKKPVAKKRGSSRR